MRAFTNCEDLGLLHASDGRLRLTCTRTPTLSYTQRLEQRVEQLEQSLAEAQKGSGAPGGNNNAQFAPGERADGTHDASPPRAADAAKLDEDEKLPFHGSTSLFQLPDSTRVRSTDHSQPAHGTASDKESLVNNAWRQRAYEKLADIPVCRATSSDMPHDAKQTI